MSTIENDAALFAQTAIPLLKEYSDKLVQLRTEAKDLSFQYHCQISAGASSNTKQLLGDLRSLQEKLERIAPAMNHFAQRVSQWIEHSAFDDFKRIELELRLAEFEADIDMARTQIAAAMPN